MANKYFNIDFGESFIKIADGVRRQKKIEILGIGLIETDPVFFSSSLEKQLEEQAQKIASLVAKLNISKTEVNVILPGNLSYNRILEMPRLNEKELLSAIRYQADQFVPMPIDEVGLDVEILLEKSNNIVALLSAAPKKLIEKVQKTIEYAGLVIGSLETEASAIGRLLSEIFSQSSEKKTPNNVDQLTNRQAHLYINFAYNSTTLYLYNPELKIVTHSRNFNIGYHLFLKEIQVNLGIDQKKAAEILLHFNVTESADANTYAALSAVIKDILSQIQKFIQELSEKNKIMVNSISLFNEVVRFTALPQIIQQGINIPSTIFDLNPLIANPNSVEFIKHELALFPASIGGNLR